ncbi:hypothetical protein CL628_03505 [bacterium]|nr:hypothetical protein [bacterium]
MNVTVINNDRIGNPIDIATLTADLVFEDLHLGIDPDGGLLERLSLVESQIVAWADFARLLFAVPDGMTVRTNWQEWGSQSSTSDALYPALWDLSARRRGGILLQILPPGATTSWHYHRHTVESFYPLFGTSLVTINDDPEVPLQLGMQVPVRSAHQLTNETGCFAINLIHMQTDLPFLDKSGKPNMSDHHYN